MHTPSFEEVVERIVASDRRYAADAYSFVREALEHTQKTAGKGNRASLRHVSGQELLGGIRDYALTTYGPMSLSLLNEWGLHRAEDFGEIVFNLVEQGVLSKTDKDQRSDFQNGFDFETAFRKPFLPERIQKAPMEQSTQV